VDVMISLGMTLAFLVIFVMIVAWMFRTGYRLKA
jgi:ABC-2 type transport system permease protein